MCLGVINMKKCNWCGSEIEDSANICPKCKATYEVNKVNTIFDRASASNQTENQSNSNFVSIILYIIGWIVIFIGVFVGWLVANDNSEGIYFFIIGGSSLISGVILIAFGEVIRLLHEINKKMRD